MTILKNRLIYLKTWRRGFYFAIGRPVSEHTGDYILRFWFNLPKEKGNEITPEMYKV